MKSDQNREETIIIAALAGLAAYVLTGGLKLAVIALFRALPDSPVSVLIPSAGLEHSRPQGSSIP